MTRKQHRRRKIKEVGAIAKPSLFNNRNCSIVYQNIIYIYITRAFETDAGSEVLQLLERSREHDVKGQYRKSQISSRINISTKTTVIVVMDLNQTDHKK